MNTDPTTPSSIEFTPSAATEAENIAAAARLLDVIGEAKDRLQEIAEVRPPLTLGELKQRVDRDPVLTRDVLRFLKDRFDGIDVTLLSREPEAWERLRTGVADRFKVVEHSTDRYEIRPTTDGGGYTVWDLLLDEEAETFLVQGTVTDEAAREDAESFVSEGNQNIYWTVVDTEEGTEPVGGVVYDDESAADDVRIEKNAEDEENLYGFPFAWNHGYAYNDGTLYEDWHRALERAGFLVYRYVGPANEDDEIIVGIDGAGYDFMSAHHVVFYGILAAQNGWLVQTSEGPRRVAEGAPA